MKRSGPEITAATRQPRSTFLGLRAFAAAALLGGCSTAPDSADLDAPIFGSSHPTTFVVAPGSDVVHARDLAAVARVLRRYKTLDAAEKGLVRARVSKRLNALVGMEVSRLTATHRAERQAIARQPDKVTAARLLAEFDAKLRREASARVLQRLGGLLAVPLKTSDNKSAVAFVKVHEKGIEVAADAQEIDHPIASLVQGESIQVAPNRLATVIKTDPVPVAPTR
jgi:hypothetical protein